MQYKHREWKRVPNNVAYLFIVQKLSVDGDSAGQDLKNETKRLS